MNTLAHIDVPKGQLENVITSESKTHLKYGRPIGSKDSFLENENENEKHIKSLVLLTSLRI